MCRSPLIRAAVRLIEREQQVEAAARVVWPDDDAPRAQHKPSEPERRHVEIPDGHWRRADGTTDPKRARAHGRRGYDLT
jgi:hypothetical protein